MNKYSIDLLINKYSDLVGNFDDSLERANEQNSVYLIYNPLNNTTKIGITSNIRTRLGTISSQSGIKLDLITCIELEMDYDESARSIEILLHSFYKEKKTKGEWFNLCITDIVNIRDLFYVIGGMDLIDNLDDFYEKYKKNFIDIDIDSYNYNHFYPSTGGSLSLSDPLRPNE